MAKKSKQKVAKKKQPKAVKKVKSTKKKKAAKKKTAKKTKTSKKVARKTTAAKAKKVATAAKAKKVAPATEVKKAPVAGDAPVAKGVPGVGTQAPTFELPTDGDVLALASFRGKKNVVLYFYPKDDTPGCTIQACSFEKDGSDFSDKNTVVIGVSADNAASHARFRLKYNLSFPLIVDEGAKLAKRYGVWVEKNMYGKKSMGVQRTTFLIDKKGCVAKVWPKVKVEGHSQDVLKALRTLD